MALHYRQDVTAIGKKTSDQVHTCARLTSKTTELIPQSFLEMGMKSRRTGHTDDEIFFLLTVGTFSVIFLGTWAFKCWLTIKDTNELIRTLIRISRASSFLD